MNKNIQVELTLEEFIGLYNVIGQLPLNSGAQDLFAKFEKLLSENMHLIENSEETKVLTNE